MITAEARSLSLAVMRGEQPFPDETELEELRNLPPAAAIERLKPFHYVRLAAVMDVLFNHIEQKQPERPPYGLLASEYALAQPWHQLRSDTLATVWESIGAIGMSDEFAKAAEINALIRSFDPDKAIDLKLQLLAGSDTAASTMLTLLRNISPVALYHGAPERFSRAELARRSSGLLWRLAMVSVNQLMAAQTVLSARIEHQSWAGIEKNLDPARFKLVTDVSGGQTLHYADLAEMTAPAGFKVYTEQPPLTEPTAIKDIGSPTPTIGCPITLLKRRFEQLWDRYVDIVDSENLWES